MNENPVARRRTTRSYRGRAVFRDVTRQDFRLL
jgi:hypothetical protein